jgi:hypothetical protein
MSSLYYFLPVSVSLMLASTNHPLHLHLSVDISTLIPKKTELILVIQIRFTVLLPS